MYLHFVRVVQIFFGCFNDNATADHRVTVNDTVRCVTIKFTNFDIRVIVHFEFVLIGQTVNQVYYLEVLKGCVKMLDGNDPKFCQQLMDLASRQCICSHGIVCEGVFSY